jgi:hypothetical protein
VDSRFNLVRAFQNVAFGPTGIETTPAATIPNANFSQVVLPPASGTTAGALAVYLGGRRSIINRSSRPLNFVGNPYDAQPRYQFWYGDFWRFDGRFGYNCSFDPNSATAWYRAWRWYDQLGSATTSVVGGGLTGVGVTIQAAGAVQSGSAWTAFGAFTTAATPSYSLSFAH